eukprot:13901228-Alexandrium_andersonii.AAC.1
MSGRCPSGRGSLPFLGIQTSNSIFGPRSWSRQAGPFSAAWKACPTNSQTKSRPTWKSSYGMPSAPGADPPARRMALRTWSLPTRRECKASTDRCP